MKNKNKIIAIIVVSFILTVAISFYCGSKYSQSNNGARQGGIRQNGGMTMNPGSRQNNQGGGFINGEIASKDDGTMTVNIKNGGSKVVLFSDKTTVSKSVEGSLSDLSVGGSIMITGTQNQDGSVSAQSIQIRPANASNNIPAGRPSNNPVNTPVNK